MSWLYEIANLMLKIKVNYRLFKYVDTMGMMNQVLRSLNYKWREGNYNFRYNCVGFRSNLVQDIIYIQVC